MAMICKKCGGIIPDVMFGLGDRNDCKNHSKGEVNILPIGDKTPQTKESKK